MKKTILWFFAITIITTLVILVGNIPLKPDSQQTEILQQYELITPVESVDISNMNLYSQSNNLYFSADSNAKISLYTNAEKDDNGEFMFDDRQEWILVLETSMGVYPLFPRQFIQLGRINYSIFNEFDENTYDIFHVIVTVQQSASHKIYDCVFDNTKKAFEIIPIYNATNINPINNSASL